MNCKKIYRDVFCIIIANIFAHGFLLLLTGTFWDDWLYIYHNTNTLWTQFLEAGIPSRAIIIQAVWKIPNYGFRWVVFGIFVVISILFYFILRRLSFFDDRSCLLIPLLFVVIPLNDCRVILCDVPYTIGLLAFFIGFYLLTLWFENRNAGLRFLTLIFFTISFTVNSLLVFYSLVYLFIYVKECERQKHLLRPLRKFFYYMDFLFLPFLFYFAKQRLFPVHGLYENYNKVSLSGMIYALFKLPLGACRQLLAVWNEFFNWLPFSWSWVAKAMFLIVIVVGVISAIVDNAGMIYYKDRQFSKSMIGRIFTECKASLIVKDLIGILLGGLIFCMGMFPYTVIRGGGSVLVTDGVGSRDTMLLPIGMAMIIYFAFSIFLSVKKVAIIYWAMLLAFGICAFNFHYLDYQRDFYWQETLTEKFRQHTELSDKSNLLFLTDDDNGCDCTRFYSLNGNAALAYQNEKRLIMNGYSKLEKMHSDKLSMYVDGNHEYLMCDYDTTNKYLDGVIIYNNYISYKKTFQLKLLELFDQEKYHEIIKAMGTFSYYDSNSAEAKELLENYENG